MFKIMSKVVKTEEELIEAWTKCFVDRSGEHLKEQGFGSMGVGVCAYRSCLESLKRCTGHGYPRRVVYDKNTGDIIIEGR